MRIVNKIEPRVPQMPTRKKVAAYARVSMESERLQHSLSAQVSYYSGLIQKNPAWEYVGVYADNGVTGTKAEAREEFNRMIADCEAGKIDIELTKSISRFARNTVDLLNTVRHLKELGVSVQFEKERIDSLTEDGELMLTLLASFAQEEVRSLSENVKWGTRKRFEKGIPNGKFQIYGYRWDGDHLVVQPEEAKIVRLIYDNFLSGLSAETTEKQLAEMGVKSYKGHTSETPPYGRFSATSLIREICCSKRNMSWIPSAENPESTAENCRSTGARIRTKPLFPWRFTRRYKPKKPAAVNLGYLPTGASTPLASPAGYNVDGVGKTISGRTARVGKIQTQTIPSGSAAHAEKQETPNARTRTSRSRC